MTVLAVTGGIGAGKSTVTAYLRKLGVPVVDADAISHKLTQKNAAGTLAVARAFGEPYVKDGEMDRRALAELVFSDPAEREKLNAILHPMILDAMRRELARLEEKGTRLAVIDVPLLFESGTDALADEIWCVEAPNSAASNGSCGAIMRRRSRRRRGSTRNRTTKRFGKNAISSSTMAVRRKTRAPRSIGD